MDKELFGFVLTELRKDRYKVSGKYVPEDMIISIKKEMNGFRASCNYSKWTKGAVSPYQSMHLHETKEQTLTELLISLSTTNETSFENFCWVDEKQKYVVRGNGEKILYKDFKW